MGELERRLIAALPQGVERLAPQPLDRRSLESTPEVLAEGGEALREGTAEPTAGEPAVPPSDEALPALEDLVKRIPPDVRAALDELFRARFTGVTRASPKAAVKPAAPK